MHLATSFGSIRPWTPQDRTALLKYAGNRKVWLTLRDGFPHPYTEADADRFFELVRNQEPLTFYAIATPDEAIGGIGITQNGDVHRLTAEMGYWLAEPYWGKGITSEAVTRFTEWAFDHFGLLRIYAEPFATNTSSCRVLEKAGFTLEGRMRSNVIKDGQILDQMLYAKVRG
jgi:RimJ/RimL family protein N-acetyltransferase